MMPTACRNQLIAGTEAAATEVTIIGADWRYCSRTRIIITTQTTDTQMAAMLAI